MLTRACNSFALVENKFRYYIDENTEEKMT